MTNSPSPSSCQRPALSTATMKRTTPSLVLAAAALLCFIGCASAACYVPNGSFFSSISLLHLAHPDYRRSQEPPATSPTSKCALAAHPHVVSETMNVCPTGSAQKMNTTTGNTVPIKHGRRIDAAIYAPVCVILLIRPSSFLISPNSSFQ